MDIQQFHMIYNLFQNVAKDIHEMLEINKQNAEMIKQNNLATKELLNFFVALEHKDDDSINAQEYLTELEKDGFHPPSG